MTVYHPHNPDPARWVGYGDAFREFGLCTGEIRRMVYTGNIRALRVKNVITFFRRSDIAEALAEAKAAPVPLTAGAGVAVSLPSIGEWADYSWLWREHQVPRGRLDVWVMEKRVRTQSPPPGQPGPLLYKVADVLQCVKGGPPSPRR